MSNVKASNVTTGQPNLSKQDLSKLDVSKLTALSPEVISRQATINIGTIGHVAHGKSTVVKAVSGVQTVRFKNELERNITIKLAEMFGDTLAEEKKEMKDSLSVPKMSQLERRKSQKRKRVSSTLKEDVYEVESIVGHREKNGAGGFEYNVKWKGWSMAQCTWEPIENLQGCLETVVEYFDKIVYQNVSNIPFTSRVETLRNYLLQYTEVEFQNEAAKVITQQIPPKNELETEHLLTLLAKLPPVARDQKLMSELKLNLLRIKISSKRNKQLKLLKQWETEINLLSGDSAPITVVNNFNLEGPPVNFMYVGKSISSISVTIPDDPLVGCECISCPQNKCCNDLSNGACYTKGVLKVKRGTPIYECNKRCQCGPDCENRVLQHGRKISLSIFMTNNGCGWGVKALQDIKKGEFVTEYVGEIISTQEAERRGKKYDMEGCTYLFDLDFNDKDNFPYTVDAANYGNISHFINHSCNPNLEVFAVWVNCLDPNLPRLGLYSCKNIKKGEELTFDYLCQPLDKDNKKRSMNQTRNLCKCNSANCRKYLF